MSRRGSRPPAGDTSASDRLYTLLLRAYPAPFRRRFADSMRFTFAQESSAARRSGRLRFLLFWCRTLAELLLLALGERIAHLGARDGSPTTQVDEEVSSPQVRGEGQEEGSFRTGPGGHSRPVRGIGQELRHAAHRLRHSPGFALATVVTLALGIGAATAIFSLVQGVVLNPLPYPHAERLVALRHSAEGAGLSLMGLSHGTFVYYREHNEVFEQIAVYTPSSVSVMGDGGARQVPAARVSQGFFEIFLAGPPALGRSLSAADQEPGAPPVAVISHELWHSFGGGDAGIVGRSITVDGVPTEVIGVLPAEFDVPSTRTGVWLPARIDPERVVLGGFGRYGVARLRPGASPEQAQADLERLIPSMKERFNPVAFDLIVTGGGLRAIVVPLRESLVGDVEQILWILFGTVLFVLATACANVANLFLVRAEARRQEIALRRALGAGRWQIVRHHLAESSILGLLGGAGGVALAHFVVRWVATRGPAENGAIPRLHEVGLDPPVLVFALLLSFGAALLFGILPVLRQSREALQEAIADGGRCTLGRSRLRTRHALVVGQVSLALVLLVGAGLLARTFWNLRSVEPGFEPDSALVFEVGLPPALYPDRARAWQFQQRILDRLATLPGALVVGATGCLPLDGCDGRTPVYADDAPVVEGQTPPSVDVRGATSGYFRAMGIPLLEGRGFERNDPQRRPVAVVSRNLAARLWPGESAIGKRIHPDYPNQEPYTVVGVVGDHLAYDLTSAPPEFLYVSYLGSYGYVAPPHTLTFVVRTVTTPLTLAEAVRSSILELDPNVPIANLQTLHEVVDRAAAPTAFAMALLMCAAGMTLVLGSVGVYGVLSYVVGLRTDEIGVRIALGARTTDVHRMVLRQGVRISTAGIAIGLAAAVALSRVLRGVLFGVDQFDPATYGSVAATLAAVALVASWLPAWRAGRIDPIRALRND